MKYDVMIDFSGTMHVYVEANSHDEAYKAGKKAWETAQKSNSVPMDSVYENFWYVEDENGLQLEY